MLIPRFGWLHGLKNSVRNVSGPWSRRPKGILMEISRTVVWRRSEMREISCFVLGNMRLRSAFACLAGLALLFPFVCPLEGSNIELFHFEKGPSYACRFFLILAAEHLVHDRGSDLPR